MRDIHIDLCNEAQDRISEGESPDNMVHFIDDDPARGLSSGLTRAELQRGGYTAHYMRLGDIAEGIFR